MSCVKIDDQVLISTAEGLNAGRLPAYPICANAVLGPPIPHVPRFLKARSREHTSTPAHQHTSTPAHQHTSTPAHQHTSTPAHQHTSLVETSGFAAHFERFCNICLSRLSLARKGRTTTAAPSPPLLIQQPLPSWIVPLTWATAPFATLLLLAPPQPALADADDGCYATSFDSGGLYFSNPYQPDPFEDTVLVEKVYVLNLNPKESNLTSLPESIFRGLNLEGTSKKGKVRGQEEKVVIEIGV